MAMQLTIPSDLEALVQKRLASGAFASAEEVLRRALEAQDDEESWTEEERRALDEKIDRALGQFTAGSIYGPDEARRKLAAMREAHLAKLGR
jgi:Arc/MetJ-type ribon-helix-helix transcriptional regulator